MERRDPESGFHHVKEKPTLSAVSYLRVASAAVFILLLVQSFSIGTLRAQEGTNNDPGKRSSAGKQVFAGRCAGCHGLDGRGGERAPNIASSAKLRRGPDSQISSVIANGIPGTGMPAFPSLAPSQVAAVVAYVRVLQGTLATAKLPGDPERGKEVFFGKGECATCHTISGKGGFLGPDLSAYGAGTPAKTVLDAILRPTRTAPPGYRSAVATTSDGVRFEGIVRNEDNFSVQIQTSDGSFHFLQKSDVQKLEYSNQSTMPTDYGDRLSHNEINDLASYLMTAGSAPKEARSKGGAGAHR